MEVLSGDGLRMKVLVMVWPAEERRRLAKQLGQAGFETLEEDDCAAAIDLALHDAPAAVLMDRNPPGLAGTEALRELRRRGCSAHVVIVAPQSSVEDRVKLLQLGADDYLDGSIALEELQVRLRTGERPWQRPPPATAAEGPTDLGVALLDTRARQLLIGGSKILLTPLEFAVLEALAHRRPEPVSRDRLLDVLSRGNHHTTAGVVEVTISSLRRKFKVHSDAPLIHTRRRAGYYLSGNADPNPGDKELECDPSTEAR